MTETTAKPKIREFYADLCMSFFGALRAFNLYTSDHPETNKKVQAFYQKLNRYLSQKPTMTWLLIGGEVVIENQPLPELERVLGKVLPMLDKINLERLTFRQGLGTEELAAFFQMLLPLLKEPSGGEMVLAKNQEKLPHILAGRLPLDSQAQVSYEDFASALESARQAILSSSAQLKELFSDIRGPLSPPKVLTAKEITETIHNMIKEGDMPLKLLVYRRSPDPDPYIHALNVSALSMALADELGLEKSMMEEIGLGALLHDIGLYDSPSDLFSTSSAMTLDEKHRYWEHPVRGAELLIASPGIPDVAPIMAYEHHIFYNGTGFPAKQSARELNLGSLIAGITDCYDNLRRDRPEQSALSLAEALNRMDKNMGERFHPLLLKRFRALVKAQAQDQVTPLISGDHRSS
jgi:HD-GYP domain-containing protein (c-di-GMP phosphodiesterase class II)